MGHTHSALARSAPGKARTIISAFVAFFLLLGLVPASVGVPVSQASADEPSEIPVLLHFKDADLETVDFAQYPASFTSDESSLVVFVGDGSASTDFRDTLNFAVYDRYASFNDRQRDITDECAYDPDAGTVRIPASYGNRASELTVVFWLTPAHPAYERFVTSQLVTDDVRFTYGDQEVVLRSDIGDLTSATESPESGAAGNSPTLFSVPFPGQQDAHYQLNPHTRLEEFDRDQTEKQKAYGYPDQWVGSYGFGALFGSHREFVNGKSTETDWNASVLNTSHSSYDAAVESYLSDTIAARLGEDAAFASSPKNKTYYDRCVTKGISYQDNGYLPDSSPAGKAMARGTCGSSDINNGAGTPVPIPDGDNYITFKGVYDGTQTQYAGWYLFYYKFDAKSGKTGSTFQDVVGYLLVAPPHGGNAQLAKVSTDPAISNANGNYSLEHGVFAAFTDKAAAKDAVNRAQARAWKTWQDAQGWAEDNAAIVFVTGKDGNSPVVEDVEPGEYFVAELFAPAGFRLSDAAKSLIVDIAESEEDVCLIEFEDTPQSGSLDLLKVSNNPGLTNGNACYSLAGATYTLFTDAACLHRFRDIATTLDNDKNGYARADLLPIGTYWVKETKRPVEGYALDPRVYPVVIADQKVTRVNTVSVSDKAKLDPLDIMLQKKDAQTKESSPQGSATLGDAHFRIDYYDVKGGTAESVASCDPRASWLVRTDDTGAFRLQDGEKFFTHTDRLGNETQLPYKVSGPDFFKLSDGQLAMPLGTYAIQEVKAPEGYLLDDTLHVRHITDADHDNEVVETFQVEEDNDLVTDRVARSDLAFLKRADGASKLAGIPFKLTSRTTGEWHILVTDKNGMASTRTTPAHAHTSRTNANDAQFRAEDGSFQLPLVLDADALDATAGTWFGLARNGEAAPVDDALGALPYDTYELEEIRCPSNALFQMIRDEIVVDESDDGAVIDLGTLNNTAVGKPTIRTSAYDGTANDLYDSEINANSAAVIIDRVTYSGLTPDTTYQLEGTLMDKATGEPLLVNDAAVTATAEFVPTDYNGYANVTFAFDASALTERTELVVFESLFEGEREIASHHDLDDREQTIVVNPLAIGTTAVDSVSGTHEGTPAEEVTLIDTVAYQGLAVGHEYRMVALLMDKETKNPFMVDDQVVTAEKTFTPEASEGAIPLEITLPGLGLDGVSLVVYESLYYDDLEVAVHADIDDEGQTVSYAYPDLPLPPTGGGEEPRAPENVVARLAQTGDGLALVGGAFALIAASSAGAAAYGAYRKRRAARK